MTGSATTGRDESAPSWYEDAEKQHVIRRYHSHDEFSRDATVAQAYGWVVSNHRKEHARTGLLSHLHSEAEIVVEYERPVEPES